MANELCENEEEGQDVHGVEHGQGELVIWVKKPPRHTGLTEILLNTKSVINFKNFIYENAFAKFVPIFFLISRWKLQSIIVVCVCLDAKIYTIILEEWVEWIYLFYLFIE